MHKKDWDDGRKIQFDINIDYDDKSQKQFYFPSEFI